MALERIVIEVSGDPKKLKSTISELEKVGLIDKKNSEQFKKNNKEFLKGVDKSKKGLSSLQSSLAGVGIALTGAFAIQKVTQGLRAILDTTKAFEAQMSRVKAITGATATEFNKLTKSANDLGASTKFTATEIGQLQEAYGKLGFSTVEILAATEATTQLAVATGEGLAASAEVAGSTLRAFDLDASETQRVVDVMAASFTSSALDLESFRESMKLVAPIAKAANIPIEATTALLGKLADSGLKGSIAGTSLKNLLSKLADENSDLSKQLGFSVKNTDDLFKAFEQLKQGNIDLTEATELTDERSKAAFLTLINGVDSAEALAEALDKARGSAKKMADTVEDNLQGDLTKLNSAIDAVARSIGDEFSPSLRELTQFFIKAIGAAKENSEAIKNFGRVVGIAASFVLGYKGALLAANVATKAYDVVTKLATLATRGFNAALRANPLGLVVGLLTAAASALFLFKDETKTAKTEEEEFNKELDETNKQLIERERVLTALNTAQGLQKLSLSQLKEALSVAKKELEEFSDDGITAQRTFDTFFETLDDGEEPSKSFKEGISEARQAILDEIKTIEAAIEEKERYLNSTDGQTTSLAELKKELAKVKKELMDQALAGDISSKSLKKFKDITKQLEDAQRRLKDALEGTTGKIPTPPPIVPISAKAIDVEGKDAVEVLKDRTAELLAVRKAAAEEAIRIAEEEARRRQQIEATVQAFIMDAGNLGFDSRRDQLDQEMMDLEAQKEFELQLAGGNAQARLNIEEKFAAEERKIKAKQAQNDKDQASFNAAISTFTAAAKALEAGPIAGPVLAALITALGIVQQIKIQNQPLPKFEKGGWIDGKRHAQGGTLIEAEKDEFIVNRIASQKNKALLEDLNKGKMINYNRQRNIAGTFADNVAASLEFNDQNLLRAIRKASKNEQEGFFMVAEALKDSYNARKI